MSIYDLKVLLFIEYAKFKNLFKSLLKNPLTAIKKVAEIAFPLLFVMLSLFMGVNKKSGNKSALLNDTSLIGAVIVSILFIIFIKILLASIFNYKPTYFSLQDVHYLFPSPISEKTIWAFNLIKDCLEFIVSYFFAIVVISISFVKFLNISILKLATSLLGIFFIVLLFKSLNFLLYSLKVKFNVEKPIKITSILIILGMIGYLLGSFYLQLGSIKDIGALDKVLAFIKHMSEEALILTTMKNIIIYPLTKSIFPIQAFIFIVGISIIILCLAIYFGQDFYENVSESIETNNIDIEDLDLDTFVIEESVTKKGVVKVKENFLCNIKGAGSFLYKAYIFGKRSGKQKRNIIMIGIFTVLSFGLGYYFRNTSVKAIEGILVGIGIFSSMSSNVTATMKYEFKKSYFYLLPGSIKSKILFILGYDYILSSAVVTALILPFGFITKISNLKIILYLILVIFLRIMISLIEIIIQFFIPIDYEGSAGIVETIVNWVAMGVAILLGLLVFKLSSSIYGVLIALIFYTIAMIIAILAVSEKAFYHMELR